MSTQTEFLESYITPVCRFEIISGTAIIRDFFGTAFFIGSRGIFMTARHVIDAGNSAVQEKSGFLGVCRRNSQSNQSVAIRIINSEAADPPYDICVGTVGEHVQSDIQLANITVNVWREVASFGFPSTAQNRSNNEFWMYGRGFRGYVHREISKGQIPGPPHPNAFETSFSMAQGLSGAPLFISIPPKIIAIGICVGINRGESTEYIFEEIQDNGNIFKEQRIKVEEYGIAHDLRPLLNWKPSNLGGLSLAEAASS